jgi:hypothetical protein
LPRDDLNEKGMNPFKCLKAKKKQTRGNLKWSGKMHAPAKNSRNQR